MRHRSVEPHPMTFGENEATRMSQRTLVIILGFAVTVGAVYADLKSDARNDHKAIESLVATRASDHDLLVKVATGVELLQRQSERNERRNDRNDVVERGNAANNHKGNGS